MYFKFFLVFMSRIFRIFKIFRIRLRLPSGCFFNAAGAKSEQDFQDFQDAVAFAFGLLL